MWRRERPWAVVQDLRPFCIKIHHRCRTRKQAERLACLSRFYSVMTVADAKRLDTEAFEQLRNHGPMIGPGGVIMHEGWLGHRDV